MTKQKDSHAARRFDEWLPFRLWVVAESIYDVVGAYHRDVHGLSRGEWRVLSTLNFLPGAGTNQLADWTNLDQTRISQVMGDLTKKALITRTADDKDRRKVVVKATPEGERIFNDIFDYAQQVEQELLEPLSARDRLAFEQRLAKLERSSRAVRARRPHIQDSRKAAKRQSDFET